MLPSLQFTEFHKFLVSAGGLSMGTAAALPVFLIKTQKASLVKNNEVSDLSPTSKGALEIQQNQMLWLLKSWPFISGTLMLAGMLLLIFGAAIWKRRQDVLNEREASEIRRTNAEEEKLRQESAALLRAHREPLEEQLQAVEEKAREVEQISERGPEQEAQPPDNSDLNKEARESERAATSAEFWLDSFEIPSGAPKNVANVLNYLRIEERAIERIGNMYKGDVDVSRQVRLGDARVDATFTSLSSDLPNLVVDVKYLSGSFHQIRSKVEEAVLEASSNSRAVTEVSKSIFRPVIIFVTPPTKDSDARYIVDNVLEQVLDDMREIERPPLTVIISRMDSLERLTVDPSWFRSSVPYIVRAD
ncbi:hypothetical protein FJK98_26330 [Micromonospora sp. HM134]|uniref:hypothetical protein n=1 Tax=Micromonospora sp. HM134 TaxID=2583243 RepID=UPI001198397E|nr:hypothetical protein [Micromonospora sp. HM134]QDY10227.1 hypothetical protein FJK98_26330 [Micromonospora sp. HM134]